MSHYDWLAELRNSKFITPPETLFEQFARLESTPDSVFQFAQNYGFLGVGEPLYSPDDPHYPFPPIVEPLERWQHEIHRMKYAFDLWSTARFGDEANSDVLEKHIVWKPNPHARDLQGVPLKNHEEVLFISHKLSEFDEPRVPATHHIVIIAQQDDDGLFKVIKYPQLRFKKWDYLSAVDAFLLLEMNEHLNPEVKLRDEYSPPAPNVSLRMTWDAANERQTTVIHPANLLTMMWLQFHEAITGRTIFQRCLRCGMLFRPNKPRGQAAKWCSNACKTAASRVRQKLSQDSPKTRISRGKRRATKKKRTSTAGSPNS